MISYRKIYEHHFGHIPKEANGRTYEIHHIDGNHYNDLPENLIAMTIQEHYNIHYAQEDWAACLAILMRMDKTPEEISKECSVLSSKNAQKRVENGTHNFLRDKNPNSRRLADGTSYAFDRVKNGTLPSLRRADGTSLTQEQVAKGIHNFLGGAYQLAQLESGTHTTQIIKTCPYRNREFNAPIYGHLHGEKCKLKGLNNGK